VGFGTRLGNGCTSGHGICGMARMSLRSYANVGCFMLTGFLTASLCGPGSEAAPWLRAPKSEIPFSFPTDTTKTISMALITLVVGAALPGALRPLSKGVTQKETDTEINAKRKYIPGIIGGALFAIGLAISGMVKMNKIFGFLDLGGFARGTWDATLILVMGGGMAVSLASYQFIKGYNLISGVPKKQLEKPILLKSPPGKFGIPTNKTIDFELLLGGLIFGVGWGIGGICPGPALWLAAAGFRQVLFIWWPLFLFGSFLAEKVKELRLKINKK